MSKLEKLGCYQELKHAPSNRGIHQDIGKNILTADETAKIIQYLKSGNVLAIATGLVYDVISEDHPVIDTLSMMTDGVYVWGCDFPYYIEKYQLYISTEFVNFVKGRQWLMPILTIEDLERLSV